MRPADAHLTPQEMEQLLFGAASSNDNASGAAASEAQQHLSGCAVCQSVAERYRIADLRLSGLGKVHEGSRLSTRGTECPADGVWIQLAAGLMDDKSASGHVSHAATCDWCGRLLKEAMEDLTQDVTPQEQEALDRLTVASPEWQRKMANQLSAMTSAPASTTVPSSPKMKTANQEIGLRDGAESQRQGALTSGERRLTKQKPEKAEKRSFSWWPRLAWTIASLAVVVTAAWVIWLKTREPDVNQLLAQAYTEPRLIELRVSGAEYSQIREQRAGVDSNTKHSAALYKALGRLAENRRPHDAGWLAAEGRAELLQGDYGSSVSTLEEAYRLAPQADDVEIDLASALFQRSSKPGFEEDLPRCVNLIRDVVTRSPLNATAWFNLAIVSERMHLFAEARLAWIEYLKIDPHSAWSQEARARKEKLEKEIEEYRKKSEQPLDSPDILVKNFYRAPVAQSELLDQKIESYMAITLTDWLPDVVANQDGLGSQTGPKGAAEITAQLAFQNHQDSWLHDLLAEINGDVTENLGILTLAKAKKSNGMGFFQEANTLSKRASRIFEAKEEAGRMGAQFEEVYSTHLLQQGEACYQKASSLLSRLHGKAYAWLEIQTLLEASICSNMTGRLREAIRGANRALALAESHKYGNLYLRALALMASLDWTIGKFGDAIRLADAGLETFWKGAYSPMRGYSLYAVLDSIAEDSQEWFTEVTVGREAIGLIVDSPYHAMLGVEFERVGNAALRSAQIGVAEDFFQKSFNHFALAPQDDNGTILRVAADVGMARVDLQQGKIESAGRRLEKSLEWAGKTDNRFVQIDFYETQADVLRAAGLTDIARKSSLQAVAIAEKSLQTLTGERERLLWMREYERSYRSLMRLELEQDPLEAFFWWEWYRAAPLRVSQRYNATVLDRPTISRITSQHLIASKQFSGEDVAVVSYILLNPEAGVWVRCGTNTRYYKLPASAHEIELSAHSLTRDYADEDSDQAGILSQQRNLYDILIRPFAGQLAGRKKLLIETDGTLDTLPFETLIDENGIPFEQEHEIAFSPGIAYLAAARSLLRPDSATTALIVENSTSRAPGINGLASFESAADEAGDIRRLMPHSRALIGPDTSLGTIMEATRHADIFYFVGHALSEKDGSGLLLGGVNADGRAEVINAAALEKFKFERVKLVVLSACGTAGDGSRTLSASGSLARMFLVSGVPQIVASRWPVDSHATSLLMAGFYRHLLSGSKTVDALRQAQQEIKSRPGYSHPYYWASFSVFGNP
jgi:CHAT domain-containing protein/cytochrome c-type biogenesis protein CcmH/NrfG